MNPPRPFDTYSVCPCIYLYKSLRLRLRLLPVKREGFLRFLVFNERGPQVAGSIFTW